MISPKSIRSKLSDSIQQLQKNRTLAFQNPESDFTRKGKCGFEKTINTILHFGASKIPTELRSYFGHHLKDIPTSSAFVQQRAKLSAGVFPFLFHHFNNAIPFSKTENGFHWIACDGSDINLPTNRKDTENFIPYKSKKGGYWQMHLNALFDITEQRFVDLVIQPRPQCKEVAALVTMVDRCSFPENTVFLGDRGYPSFNLMAHIAEKNMYFLFRSKKPDSSGCMLKGLPLPDSGEYDKDISIGITRSRKKKYTKHPEKYRSLGKKQRFDFISIGDRETVYTLAFRVVCVELSEGEYEYLITNLPRQSFDIQKLKACYWKRWRIEVAFRNIKYALSMVRFHSRNREFIKQEIYARMIMYNYTSLLAKWADKKMDRRNTKWKYAVSFSNAVSVARDTLRSKMSDKEVLAHLSRYKIPIKPGRKAVRNVRSQSAVPLNYRGS